MGRLMELIGIIVFGLIVFFGVYHIFLTSAKKKFRVDRQYTQEEIDDIVKAVKVLNEKKDGENNAQ